MAHDTLDSLLFLDTETTGREESDRVFQIAYEYRGAEYCEMFKPPVPLCIEAMEATGYTNRDVADKQPFAGSPMHTHLCEILVQSNVIFVAHNAPFDIDMLSRDGIVTGAYIDTLKVARHLDPDAKLGAYRLQYLRYALDLDVVGATAHDALGDVRVLKALFVRLFDKMIAQYTTVDAVLNAMISISAQPSIIRRFTFGKYSGELVADIAARDRGYIEWLLRQKESDTSDTHDQRDDWAYTLRTVLDKST